MLTELQKRIIAVIQGDMPICERPYLQIAQKLGVSETRLLEEMQCLCDNEIIRRFGATLRHQKSGFRANAMVAWQVDEAKVEEVGSLLAGFKEVSHCYRRNPTGNWPYNLYTMIHAADADTCHAVARRMSQTTGVTNYTLLFSRRELKKTSMQYFQSGQSG
jgi:DNA-binding Lrp family transcriptional regulator